MDVFGQWEESQLITSNIKLPYDAQLNQSCVNKLLGQHAFPSCVQL